MKKLLFLLILLFSIPVCFAQPYLTISYQLSQPFLKPGSEIILTLSLTNPGSKDVGRIRVFAYPGPSLILSSNYFELPGLNPNSNQIVSLKVKALSSSNSQLSHVNIKAQYILENMEREISLSIPIQIRAEPLLQITNISFNPEPEPGKEVELSFLLSNFGQGSAKDLTVRVLQSETFGVVGENEKFLDEVKAGESKEVSFILLIKPSSQAGIYSIPISLTYFDETRAFNYSIAKSIDLKISGSYEFLVSLKTQDILIPNSFGNVEIRIANTGNQEAKYLTVEIEEGYPFVEISPKQIYVGSLDKDDYETEKISLRVGEAPPGIYPLSLTLRYKDAFGKSFEEHKVVYIKIYSLQEVKKPSFMWIYSVLAIIIIYFAYKFFIRRKGK